MRLTTSAAGRQVRGPGHGLGASRGLLAPLAVVGSAGLLAVSLACMLSRSNPQSDWAQTLFWGGLCLIVLPPAARLTAAGAARAERAGSLLVIGVLLYLVKVVHDPFGFTYADEWVHVYNAQQISHTGSLFHANPIIPVTARYPGLEGVTAGVAALTHLSTFVSGVIVVGAARLVFVLALFLLVERITGSARIAGFAGIVYSTNPNFLFWSAQYSYESIALPLALFAVVAVVKRWPIVGSSLSEKVAWSVVACLATIATVMSHHLTAFALCGFLVAACAVAWVRRSTRREAPWALAGFAIAATALWVREVAPGTGHYLFPVFARGFHQTVATVLGHTTGRSPFGGAAPGQLVAPTWQRLVALASVGLIALALPFGLIELRRRSFRDPFAVVLAVAAVAYVAVMPMRLVPAAWETSNRSSEFLFVGIALTLALALSRLRVPYRLSTVAPCACIAVLLIGGTVAGWPPRVLLALPYRAHADGGAEIVPQPEAVAVWARTTLGPGRRFVAPEAVGRELLVHGRQTVFVTSAPFNAATILFEGTMTSGIVAGLTAHSIGYVAEDRFVAGDDSMAGYFFRSAESEKRVDPRALEKFDSYPGVDRLLDSGDIAIYDVAVLNGTR